MYHLWEKRIWIIIWEKRIWIITIFPIGLFLVNCTKEIFNATIYTTSSKGIEIFLRALQFPWTAFHHDYHMNFKHFVYKVIITLLKKRVCFILVSFSFSKPYLLSECNSEFPIKWSLKLTKQLQACAQTMLTHIAPRYQDENKIALLVVVANSGNSNYSNFEETAVICQKWLIC